VLAGLASDVGGSRREVRPMTDRKLLSFGLGGSLITALCCFTPILVWTLGALGLGALIAGLDDLLLPTLLLFVGLTVFALVRKRRAARELGRSR
jgi:mercuric ion transport protein